jgi:imidazolonepropionase
MTTLVSNIGRLVTPVGQGASFGKAMSDVKVYEGVDLVLRDGRVEAIRRAGESPEAAREIDARGRVVIPALVDPHRHGTIMRTRGIEGEGGAAAEGEASSDVEGVKEEALRRALRRAEAEGTLAVEIKFAGERSEALDALSRAESVGEETAVCIAGTLLLGVSDEEGAARDDRISNLIGEIIPAARRRRLGRFCDVACGPGGFRPREARSLLRAARGAGLLPKVHALGHETDAAAQLAADLKAASVDHLATCSSRVARALARAGTVAVLLPGSAFLADTPYPDARGLIRAGTAVALGSDLGPKNAGLASMWSVLGFAIEKMDLTLEEALTACTLNAAAAVDLADERGSIEPGKQANLVILDVEDPREIGGSLGVNPVEQVIARGELVRR